LNAAHRACRPPKAFPKAVVLQRGWARKKWIEADAHGETTSLGFRVAKRLAEEIKGEGDRAEFFRQFAIGPWFGLDGRRA
jgi:hypothetical protein